MTGRHLEICRELRAGTMSKKRSRLFRARDFEINLAGGNFPERQNNLAIVRLVLDQRLGTLVKLLGPLGCNHG